MGEFGNEDTAEILVGLVFGVEKLGLEKLVKLEWAPLSEARKQFVESTFGIPIEVLSGDELGLQLLGKFKVSEERKDVLRLSNLLELLEELGLQKLLGLLTLLVPPKCVLEKLLELFELSKSLKLFVFLGNRNSVLEGERLGSSSVIIIR